MSNLAKMATKKVEITKTNPFAFLMGAVMAGVYVGFGIILIFTVGAKLPAASPLIMGTSFGVALTLVIFAGSELFTGLTMTCTFAYMQKRISGPDVLRTWVMAWIGNLCGALLVSSIYIYGDGHLVHGGSEFIQSVADKKMHNDAHSLVLLGLLCNWLVCLAVWCSGRTTNDAAKLLLIFWCLFAFIASGYEHSIANMTVFSVSLFEGGSETVTVLGAWRNLFWVTIGNIIGGSVCMGLFYYIASPSARTSIP
jgi:nitrite transporter NirC